MTHQDKLITENIISQIRRERDNQRYRGFNDKAWVNGELISGAVSYADLAKKQIVTRDMSPVHELRKSRFNTGRVPSGGFDVGYNTKSPIANRPTTWQLDERMWFPGNPRANLVRAAALIIAELERLERADREAVAVPKRGPTKITRIDVGAANVIYDSIAQTISLPYNTTVTDPITGGKVYAYQNVGGGMTTSNTATFKVNYGGPPASSLVQQP